MVFFQSGIYHPEKESRSLSLPHSLSLERALALAYVPSCPPYSIRIYSARSLSV
jgi:hypothetical protein